ncbi:ankyrin repeat protein [Indivirus ILV1]|uniref:Ankyrin repeat protein n=1 Tax=Indivirus ILV1 TaxID=1977633 RepID=A0A1V0SCM3_9VIRU|nr:ankyrin repeat protein [Indivirus ILV1]
MNYLDMDLSDITTNTLGSLSDLNDSIMSTQKQSGGGIFDALFGRSSSKYDDAVLTAARQGNYNVVDFMIDQNAIDLSAQDENGNTVLHHLVGAASPNHALISKILKTTQSGGDDGIKSQTAGGNKNFINIQNKDGDTPLIVAVKKGHHDLCSELIIGGSDKTIRNAEGLRVETETPEELFNFSPKYVQEVSALPLQEGQNELFNSPTSPFPENSNIFMASEGSNGNESLVNLLNRQANKSSLATSAAESYKGNWSESIQEAGCGCGSTRPPVIMADTETLLNDLQKYFSVDANQSGGSNVTAPTENTETFLNALCTKMYNGPNQLGGTCGIRTPIVVAPNDSQTGGKKKKTKKSRATSRNMELGRIINAQTDEIIKRVVSKIQNLIEEDKKTFKGLKADEATAKAAKAILWKMIKEQNPDMKSSLDVAIAMEKMATTEMIKSLKPADIKKIMKDISEHRAEKEKHMKEKELSSTSSESVPEMSNVSETSA